MHGFEGFGHLFFDMFSDFKLLPNLEDLDLTSINCITTTRNLSFAVT